MLHHGRIIFEGPDEQFSNDPVIWEFLEYDMITGSLG